MVMFILVHCTVRAHFYVPWMVHTRTVYCFVEFDVIARTAVGRW